MVCKSVSDKMQEGQTKMNIKVFYLLIDKRRTTYLYGFKNAIFQVKFRKSIVFHIQEKLWFSYMKFFEILSLENCFSKMLL